MGRKSSTVIMLTMKNHILLAHSLWSGHLAPDGLAVDATCGNGHDTLVLSRMLPKGKVFAFDIQKQAIENTRLLLEEHKTLDRVELFQQSHAEWKGEFEPPHLIVYNLGYLPRSDKIITTLVETTIKSVQTGLEILLDGGALSIMCYPGHAEGEREEKALLDFLSTLPSSEWTVCHHHFPNRPKSPSLFWVLNS
ncbi:methyltransferase domain-containing protein [Candidatus Dojkabacteria bacterium]|uniref:Methyltransferase domain-containing protein n=1 Tax=Candidatus Dojkabacteria bacterium TaxID=2099670 RepID=A0A5C7J389_9BACT|nr:MAG: methyltransferase domain-containing protein [Candidatus Dojkabacteria bacterium]